MLSGAGDISKARLALTAAYPDLMGAPDYEKQQQLFGYVRASVHAGDIRSANVAAEQLGALAAKPQLLQAASLSRAADAYNDLSDHQQAEVLLRRAIPLLPGNNPYVGVGGAVGDVGQSMRADVAEQFQRAGDEPMFEAQYRQLSSWWKSRVWSDLCDPGWPQRPREAECNSRVGPALLLQRATDKATKGDRATSSQLLASAIDGYGDVQPDAAVSGLLDCARLAFAISRTEELDRALTEAAKAADRTKDAGDREVLLADVAALHGELVD
jgi:tetratricopeptide (TPR) repeat protein